MPFFSVARASGLFLHVVLVSASGLMWKTTGTPAYAAYDPATPTAFALPMTEITGVGGQKTGTYFIDIPTGFNAATSEGAAIEVRVRQSASASITHAEIIAGGYSWGMVYDKDGLEVVTYAQRSATKATLAAGSAADSFNYLEAWDTDGVPLPATAPAGYGSATQLRPGPFKLTPRDTGLDGQISPFVDDVVPQRFDLTGQDGEPIDLTSCTMIGTLTNAAGEVQDDAVSISTTNLNVAEGQVLATITVPGTAGSYQLTITRTASATDVQTFGPFIVRAQRK